MLHWSAFPGAFSQTCLACSTAWVVYKLQVSTQLELQHDWLESLAIELAAIYDT